MGVMSWVGLGVYSILAIISFKMNKGWRWGFFLGCLGFGIYNEFFFASAWNYSDKLKPFLWEDVSLAIILGWGFQGLFALTLSDWLYRKFKWESGVKSYLMDVTIFTVINMPTEYIFSEMGLWNYNFPEQQNRMIQVLGYLFCSSLMMSFGRRLQTFFVNKEE